jgi:hypothetical protein
MKYSTITISKGFGDFEKETFYCNEYEQLSIIDMNCSEREYYVL